MIETKEGSTPFIGEERRRSSLSMPGLTETDREKSRSNSTMKASFLYFFGLSGKNDGGRLT